MSCPPAASRWLFSAALLASATFGSVPAPVLAQPTRLVQPIANPNDPVERLGRYIRILTSSPRDLAALLGAGEAALDVGDANAALGFYARAEDVAPSSGRVKAGLGSSLVMIERPDDALRLFAQAVALGMPEADVARDRGLAYDLRGDSKRAQNDYALAMQRGRDDELVRRYALSLGISGDRAGAMAMLDPLLRKQDQGAWRARAFIMAMTGDVPAANRVARQLMVPAMANAMSPLLTRLATLNAAERAHAVNFGTVPADGTQLAVQTGDPFLGAPSEVASSGLVSAQGISRAPVASGDNGLIPAGEPLGPRPVDVRPMRVAKADPVAPRRRPGPDPAPPSVAPTAGTTPAMPPAAVAPGGGAPDKPAVAGSRRIGARLGPVDPARMPPEARGEAVKLTRVDATSLPPPDSARPLAQTQNVPSAATLPATTPADPPFETRPIPAAKAPAAVVAPAPADSASSRLAGLLEGLERESESAATLPNAAELRAARAAAKKKMAQLAAQTAAEEAAKREKAEKAAAAKRNPARIWVQIATGRNNSGLSLTLKRIRSDNEVALKGLSGWSAPYKTTNRILVGPMKSAGAARELVGKLAKNGVSAMTFNSGAGEEVEKIAAK
jgi:Flp pilus assembly protein TadD